MFYTFRQNNSRGVMHRNIDINEFVVIEGDSMSEVRDQAVTVGIYFDGCARGMDCYCCGDRWYMPEDDEDMDAVPSIYGRPIETFKRSPLGANVVIHYRNGSVAYSRYNW